MFIVWFGIGESPKITLIALAAAIPLYLNTFAGIRGVDGRLAELGQVLGLRRSEMIRHIILPGALPTILVGLRQSLGTAWLALVVAEQINANAGLGYIINQGETVPPAERDLRGADRLPDPGPAHRLHRPPDREEGADMATRDSGVDRTAALAPPRPTRRCRPGG